MQLVTRVEQCFIAGGHGEGQDWCSSPLGDRPFGYVFSEACRIHDLNYGPNTTLTREQADAQFYSDMRALCAAQDAGIGCAIVAGIYYMGVRTAGALFYQGDDVVRSDPTSVTLYSDGSFAAQWPGGVSALVQPNGDFTATLSNGNTGIRIGMETWVYDNTFGGGTHFDGINTWTMLNSWGLTQLGWAMQDMALAEQAEAELWAYDMCQIECASEIANGNMVIAGMSALNGLLSALGDEGLAYYLVGQALNGAALNQFEASYLQSYFGEHLYSIIPVDGVPIQPAPTPPPAEPPPVVAQPEPTPAPPPADPPPPDPYTDGGGCTGGYNGWCP